MDAVALAQKIAYANEGEALPDEAAAWLRVGLGRWLRGEASLEIALRLNDAACRASRNQALFEAASILDDGRGLSAWELAGLLCKAQAYFESGALVKIRRGIDVPLTPLSEALLKAWRIPVQPIRTQRRLWADVLKR